MAGAVAAGQLQLAEQVQGSPVPAASERGLSRLAAARRAGCVWLQPTAAQDKAQAVVGGECEGGGRHEREEDEEEDGEEACVVCFVRPCEVLLAPCGHRVLCGGCCREIRHRSGQVRMGGWRDAACHSFLWR